MVVYSSTSLVHVHKHAPGSSLLDGDADVVAADRANDVRCFRDVMPSVNKVIIYSLSSYFILHTFS